jgi:hypothetical protein
LIKKKFFFISFKNIHLLLSKHFQTSTLLEVHGPPHLMQAGRQPKIEMDANDQLRLRVPMRSLPEPEVDVFLNGELITPELRSTIDLYENEVAVTRKHMQKPDRGTYKLFLFNEYGDASQEFEVFVRASPEAPTSLSIVDVGHDFTTVKWRYENAFTDCTGIIYLKNILTTSN